MHNVTIKSFFLFPAVKYELPGSYSYNDIV